MIACKAISGLRLAVVDILIDPWNMMEYVT
jgi:hypothetical protein